MKWSGIGWAGFASLVCALAVAPSARAAIEIAPGPNTVTTQRLMLDFGDAGGNVERLDTVRWNGTNGAFGANLVSNGGVGGCRDGDPPDQWGAAASVGAPSPVGNGSSGTWTPRGRRSVEIVSTRPAACTADTGEVPVRTRYTFFDAGASASKVRVERRFGFGAGSPDYTSTSMRAYVPHLPGSFGEILHPDAAGTALVRHTICPGCTTTNWKGTWFAVNDPHEDSGMVVLREPASFPARLSLESDARGGAAAAVDLLMPAGGWKAPVTETEWLCFYDAASWPPAQRAPGSLPPGCSIQDVPIPTAAPTISGAAKVGGELVATGGAFDYATDARAFQWLRCAGAACAPIAGATADRYTARAADEGATLRVDVTATAPGGESDTASAESGVVGQGPPTSTAAPTVAGEVRQDEVLTASPGAWTGAPTSYAYQWLDCSVANPANCSPVAGATAATYRLARDDAGSAMRVRVTAANAAGTSLPADSAPTAAVLPFVTRAALRLSPQTSCAGLPVTLDASGSKSPDGPIVRYRFESQAFPGAIVLAGIFGGPKVAEQYFAKTPKTTLYDGTDPSPSVTFNWNRQVTDPNEAAVLSTKLGAYARDGTRITLTVTDRAGKTATTFDTEEFAQPYSTVSRRKCPRSFAARVRAVVPIALHPTATKTRFDASFPCTLRINCAVSYTLAALVPRAHARARLRGSAAAAKTRTAKRRTTIIARSGLVEIPAGQRKRVSAKLTRPGRKLLRTRTKARLTVTSVAPSGKRLTRTFTVKIGGRGK